VNRLLRSKGLPTRGWVVYPNTCKCTLLISKIPEYILAGIILVGHTSRNFILLPMNEAMIGTSTGIPRKS